MGPVSRWSSWARYVPATVENTETATAMASIPLRKSDHRERSDRRIVNTEIGPS